MLTSLAAFFLVLTLMARPYWYPKEGHQQVDTYCVFLSLFSLLCSPEKDCL